MLQETCSGYVWFNKFTVQDCWSLVPRNFTVFRRALVLHGRDRDSKQRCYCNRLIKWIRQKAVVLI